MCELARGIDDPTATVTGSTTSSPPPPPSGPLEGFTHPSLFVGVPQAQAQALTSNPEPHTQSQDLMSAPTPGLIYQPSVQPDPGSFFEMDLWNELNTSGME